MDHPLILFGVNNLSLVNGSEGQDVETSLGHGNEVLLLAEDEASYLRLPKLEALMSEQGCLALVLRDVHHSDIIGVNVDCFEADNQFFVPLVLVSMSEHKDVGVSKVELVLPLGQEGVLRRILFIHSNNEETKLLFKLVG